MPLEATPNPGYQQQPIVIRGHHLDILSDYLLYGYPLQDAVDAAERFSREAQVLPSVLPGWHSQNSRH